MALKIESEEISQQSNEKLPYYRTIYLIITWYNLRKNKTYNSNTFQFMFSPLKSKHGNSKPFTIYKDFNQVNISLSKFLKDIDAKIKSLKIYVIIRIHHLQKTSILPRPGKFEASLSAFIIRLCTMLCLKMKNGNVYIYITLWPILYTSPNLY